MNSPPSNPTASEHSTAPQRSWLSRHRWQTILATIFTIIVCGVGYTAYTSVSGTELNCTTWRVRNFSFRRDPFTNTQLTGIRYSQPSQSGVFQSSGKAKFADIVRPIRSLLKSKPGFPQRWDVVDISNNGYSKGQADILYSVLDSQRWSNQYWEEWTTDHPKKAIRFWPAVQLLTMLSLYQDIPTFMEIATEDLDVAEFDQRITSQMHLRVLSYCQTSFDAELTRMAAGEALTFGDNPALQAFVDVDLENSDPNDTKTL